MLVVVLLIVGAEVELEKSSCELDWSIFLGGVTDTEGPDKDVFPLWVSCGCGLALKGSI